MRLGLFIHSTLFFFSSLLVSSSIALGVRAHSFCTFDFLQDYWLSKLETHLLTMASATRLPLKSIAFTTAVVAAAGISHVNIQKLLSDVFTGPGSYSRIAATVVILANLKSLPGVWHVCSPFLCSPPHSLSTREKDAKIIFTDTYAVPSLECNPQTSPLHHPKHPFRSRSRISLPPRHHNLLRSPLGMRLQFPQIE